MTAPELTRHEDTFDEWLTGFRRWAGRGGTGPDARRAAPVAELLALAVPESAGGAGAGYRAAAVALAALADDTGDAGLPFSLAAQMWACQEPLIAFGAPSQQDAYLAPLLAGRTVGAFAATEYDAGSDLLSMRTDAQRRPDGSWVLTGSKTFVTNGPVAGIFVVLARTGAGSALGGLTAFLVPRGTPGLTIGPDLPTTALAGARLCTLVMDDCVVPPDACLGPPGAGFAVIMHAMRYERALILAPVIGLMTRALRRAIEHARSRHQFGRSLSSFDGIRQHLARMQLSLTTARELLLATAAAADAGTLDHGRSALTKLHVSTEFNAFCQHLPDVYGGYALLPESGVTALIADAVASRYYSGTTDMQMKIVAEGLDL
ncbi:acyl-CoA dehydrogenase family protein [Micromonospora lupini]|uniref:acyl-CoA dehydrogenase family protein n=1 Tax=Micromonospora lupini TaxID=285679 RepID=UPI0033CF87A8